MRDVASGLMCQQSSLDERKSKLLQPKFGGSIIVVLDKSMID